MTEIYLHCLFAHYGLYGNAPVVYISRPLTLIRPFTAAHEHGWWGCHVTVLSVQVCGSGTEEVKLTSVTWLQSILGAFAHLMWLTHRKILRNARIKNVGKCQSCMLSKVRITADNNDRASRGH